MIGNSTIHASLGEFIAILFEEYLKLYENSQLASLAVAATLNELVEHDPDSIRRILSA